MMQAFCRSDEQGKEPVRAAMHPKDAGARSYPYVLKSARTMADLAGETELQTPNLAEALQYRLRCGT